MRLPRYPAYKESGVTWLGPVPEHWTVKRFKWLIERNDGGVWGDDPDGDDDTIVLRSTDQTVDGRWKLDEPALRKLSESERLGATLEVGDLLVTKSSGSSLHIGKTTLVDGQVAGLRGCYSNFMQRIRLNSALLPELAWYVMNNDLARRQFDLASNSTTGLANLNGTMISDVLIPVPDQLEQTKIVSFLDHETAKIDGLIAEQEKLIALLAEKRQATISHAVTRGLNPQAPMKDSGVPWLGEVPAHWVRTPIKHALNSIIDTEHKTVPFYEDGEFLVARTSNIKDGTLTLDEARYTDALGYAEWTKRGKPVAGDIILTREAPAGEACIVPSAPPLCLGQRTVLLKPNLAMINPRYALWSIYGGLAAEFVAVLAQGSTVAHFNMSDIGNIPVLLPPLEEQAAVVEFIDAEVGKLDQLRIDSCSAIGLLKERRSALIAAAVTGQIDVRGFTAA